MENFPGILTYDKIIRRYSVLSLFLLSMASQLMYQQNAYKKGPMLQQKLESMLCQTLHVCIAKETQKI